MSARSSRIGASSAGILLAAAALVGVNYLALRHWKRFDWTHTQIYSLSDTTKKILDGLKQPVQVTVFMVPGRSRLLTEVKELLARYPRYELGAPIVRAYSSNVRGLARLPIVLEPSG